MEKTIGHLKSKVWYRLIKVLYIILMIIAFGIGVAVIYSTNIEYPMNDRLSRITCHSPSTYFDVHHDIRKKDYGITGTSLTKEQVLKIANDFCIKREGSFRLIDLPSSTPNPTNDYLEKNSTFTASHSVMDDKLNLGKFIGFTVGLLFSIVLITEIIRRAFYYIALGTLKPKE